MPWITSANIACGFHAGDPATMRRTVRLAVEHRVGIGAHVAYPDLLGFGRRAMAIGPDEVRDLVTYQLGALQAFAAAEGARVTHVKAHGALYAACASDPELAGALAAAVGGVDRSLPVLLPRAEVRAAVVAHRVGFALEAFPDLDYDGAGDLVIERVKRDRDPAEVAARAVRLAAEGRIATTAGPDLELRPVTLCLHGDAPRAAATARAVREALEAAGVAVEPLAR